MADHNIAMKLSHLSETLIGSEIVKLGGEIREKIRQGEHIYNFTVAILILLFSRYPKNWKMPSLKPTGSILPITLPQKATLICAKPSFLLSRIMEELDYGINEILVASGGRPLIYAVFRAVCDKGDKIIYAVPSWNNNHYTHFVGGEHIVIEAKAENNFMPTAEDIRPHIQRSYPDLFVLTAKSYRHHFQQR